MDFILEKADEYVFNSVYTHLPAIPIPDLIAGAAAIPSWSEFHSLLSSSAEPPLAILKSIAQNVATSTFAANLTLNTLPTDDIIRQSLTLLLLTYLGALMMYLTFATSSYYLVFDQTHKKHPKYLKNQISLEIQMSLRALPGIAVLTTPWFLGEVRGWSKVYTHIHSKDALISKAVFNPPSSVIQETVAAAVTTATGYNATAAAAAAAATAATNETTSRLAMLGPIAPLIEPFTDGWGYVAFSLVAFLLFTDCGIYWIHRFLHHPLVYKRIHKPHHKWIVPTPFSSHAFHFLDGYLQSVPYHMFVYLVPMNKYIYLIMFALVNFWSVLIHDGEYMISSAVINSAAHHTVHHLYFNYNYGQYFTLWDRLGSSYRKPGEELLNPKLKADKSVWKKQSKDVDAFDEFGKPTAASDETFKVGPHVKTKAL
ncbi:c-5 sterol desaturase [Haplosporangium sp. Z 767]|nr:c-5 sterol desaturase [Haplosporangium sp. Z 767]KAF9195874.1 c-5 sterol desaturase [Haplosporangium sp. Z 11]